MGLGLARKSSEKSQILPQNFNPYVFFFFFSTHWFLFRVNKKKRKKRVATPEFFGSFHHYFLIPPRTPRQLGFSDLNVYLSFDQRIEYNAESLLRVIYWPEPLQCDGTEPRFSHCPLRLNGQIYGHE